MNFFKKRMLPLILGLVLVIGFLNSCEEDLTTIGAGVVGAEAFTSGREIFDVFVYNKDLQAVRANRLEVYQLGRYNHPVFGNTEASINSQLQLSAVNPTFGAFSQSTEDVADTDASVSTIAENETIKEVFLYIPFFSNAPADTDLDGVSDELDAEPSNPDNDSDGDGVANRLEVTIGTNPNDMSSVDANLDGFNDTDSTAVVANNFAQTFELDSIYGAIEQPFRLKVERSTFFLRDFDPNSNFQQSQPYFSSQQFSPEFVSEVLYDSEVSGDLMIDNEQILLAQEDNTATAEVDESLTFLRLNPGIRVPLDAQFFQENILDKEGAPELFTDANFKAFLRGINISLASDAPEGLMVLLDITQARIDLTYTYNAYNTNGTTDVITDDSIDVLEGDYSIGLITGFNNGNAINTFVNEAYPQAINESLNTGENTDRIYLKGGSGIFAEIDLFEPGNGTSIIDQIQAENWIINEANLVFYIDREQLDMVGGVIEPPRLYLYDTETNSPLYNPFTERSDAQTLFGAFLNYDGIIEKSGETGLRYTVRITEYINNLVARDAANATLGLALTTDIFNTSGTDAILTNGEEAFVPLTSVYTPLGTVLFGSNLPSSDPNFDKRLRLEIFYTQVD